MLFSASYPELNMLVYLAAFAVVIGLACLLFKHLGPKDPP